MIHKRVRCYALCGRKRRPSCRLAHVVIAIITVCGMLALTTVSAFSSIQSNGKLSGSSTIWKAIQGNVGETDDNGEPTWTRREALSNTACSIATAAATTTAALTAFSPLQVASAVAATTREEIFAKLSGIPTFCIVNGPGSKFDGIPFGIYDRNTATATGYFFMTYETAQQALKAASDLDSSRGDENIWMTAEIKVVPLSIALQLAMVRRLRVSVNEEKGVQGIKVETVHNLIPSDAGNTDAKTLDTNRKQNPKKWETKGRVPLFSIPEGGKLAKKQSYYFETNDLIDDYKRKHSSDDPSMAFLPEIQLEELVYVFRQALQSNDWDSLLDFANTIQPSPEARADAIKLLQAEAASKTQAAPYNFEKIFLVVSAK